MRGVATTLVMLILAVASVGWATAGFEALTAEGARQVAVDRAPVALPSARLTFADGSEQTLAAYLEATDGATIINFIFTRCTGACAMMGNEFLELNRKILERGAQGKVRLLTISFDPTHDDAAVLASYAARFGANPSVWRFATIRDQAELERLLGALGLVVIPDGAGGFQHNSAFHIAVPSGELVAIVDSARPSHALSRALGVAGR